MEVHTSLLHYCTCGLGAANDAQNVRADTARGKDNDQQNISKMIMWYRSVYNQIASDSWRYNNPVYKPMTDKLQLMLINVLLDQFLNIKVSQRSVATCLRCDGIFNDHFITQSLPSLWVKKKLKIGQHLPKLWAIKYRVVILWNTVYKVCQWLCSTFCTDISRVSDNGTFLWCIWVNKIIVTLMQPFTYKQVARCCFVYWTVIISIRRCSVNLLWL